MHAGFAMLSAGALRTKNTRNVLISTLMDLTVCCIAWYLCGFAFAFGNDQGGFIGSSYWVGIDVGSQPTGNAAFYFWLFEFCFAATGATIVCGAVAERARFDTYLVYSFFMSFWVYPVIAHWVWGGGFLTLGNPNGVSLMGVGSADAAGSGVVHLTGGLAGAIGSKIMGPRIGRFDPENGKPIPIPGHSSPLATLGVFILWIGWFGFNPGSIVNLGGGNGVIASRAAVTTLLASASAALSALFFSHLISADNEYDIGMALNGALAGLVSITAPCFYVEMWAAVCIGVIGGVVYVSSSIFTLHVLKIDDPLDATPVHLFCGIWGLVASGFFSNPVLLAPFFNPSVGQCLEIPSGVFYGGNSYMTRCNINGVIEETPGGPTRGALITNSFVEIFCIIAWVSVFMTPLFLALSRAGVLRVASDIESVGLDVSHHGGDAYPEHLSSFGYEEPKRHGMKSEVQRLVDESVSNSVVRAQPSMVDPEQPAQMLKEQQNDFCLTVS